MQLNKIEKNPSNFQILGKMLLSVDVIEQN